MTRLLFPFTRCDASAWKPTRQAPMAREFAFLRCVLKLALLLCIAGCNKPNFEWIESLKKKVGPDPIRVGILHSQTGTRAISETPLRHAEILAIEEINKAGGVLGRQLEPIVKDGHSRQDHFRLRSTDLIEEHDVAVVFGCWTSADRKAVLPIFEQSNKLLFYPLQYEGNESSRNVFYSGSTPNQQILPAIDWFLSDEGGNKKKIFLIGSDYVYPRTANYIVKKYLGTKSMNIAGEIYVPLGHRDFGPIIEQIVETQPDLILSTINGDSNIHFYRNLHERGITASQLPVVATSIGEGELRVLPPETTQGHYAVWSYFQSLDSAENQKFVQLYKREFGHDRVVDDPMEAAYTQVFLWKQAVEKAGTTDTDAVRKALEAGIEVNAPGGRGRLDGKTHHMHKRFRLGRIRGDRQFDIVYESADTIAPDPYPEFAFPGWSCDWTRGGIKKGPVVTIP
ncbi:MAG: ABC transporter substrate-binding protein [Pirellula sp.]